MAECPCLQPGMMQICLNLQSVKEQPFWELKFLHTGLTLSFAIVAICYKNDRVATDLFHWRKVHFRQIKSPFSPIMVKNLLTGDLYVNTCILLC